MTADATDNSRLPELKRGFTFHDLPGVEFVGKQSLFEQTFQHEETSLNLSLSELG